MAIFLWSTLLHLDKSKYSTKLQATATLHVKSNGFSIATPSEESSSSSRLFLEENTFKIAFYTVKQ